MMDTNLPSNSSQPPRSRDEPRKVERVVQGQVTRRKTPLGRRIGQSILGGDSQTVWGYIFGEALIPTIQNLVVDIVGGGIEKLVYPDSRPVNRARRGRVGGFTDYQSPSRYTNRHRDPRDEPRHMSRRGRANHAFDEIIIESRAEAEEVLDRLEDMARRYEVATVANLYHLVGISGAYTDEKYGWTEQDLREANVARAGRSGYLLNLPRPEQLD